MNRILPRPGDRYEARSRCNENPLIGKKNDC